MGCSQSYYITSAVSYYEMYYIEALKSVLNRFNIGRQYGVMDYANETEDARTAKVIIYIRANPVGVYLLLLLLLLSRTRTYIYYSNANLIICRIQMCLTPYVSHAVPMYTLYNALNAAACQH